MKAKTIKAIIFVDIWAKRIWAYHEEKKIRFNRLQEARDWATKNGFDGITIKTNSWRHS